MTTSPTDRQMTELSLPCRRQIDENKRLLEKNTQSFYKE